MTKEEFEANGYRRATEQEIRNIMVHASEQQIQALITEGCWMPPDYTFIKKEDA